jgi:hypothetical protein
MFFDLSAKTLKNKKQMCKKSKQIGNGFVYCHWCQTALCDWYEVCPHCGMPIIND